MDHTLPSDTWKNILNNEQWNTLNVKLFQLIDDFVKAINHPEVKTAFSSHQTQNNEMLNIYIPSQVQREEAGAEDTDSIVQLQIEDLSNYPHREPLSGDDNGDRTTCGGFVGGKIMGGKITKNDRRSLVLQQTLQPSCFASTAEP